MAPLGNLPAKIKHWPASDRRSRVRGRRSDPPESGSIRAAAMVERICSEALQPDLGSWGDAVLAARILRPRSARERASESNNRLHWAESRFSGLHLLPNNGDGPVQAGF